MNLYSVMILEFCFYDSQELPDFETSVSLIWNNESGYEIMNPDTKHWIQRWNNESGYKIMNPDIQIWNIESRYETMNPDMK